MAFGDIKGTKTGSATSITASFPISTGTNFAVVVGDLIVTALAEQSAKTVTACADNLGNTYTAIGPGADAGTVTGRAFYTRVTVAGTISTVTFTATASANNCVGLAVGFEGPFAVSPLDATPTAIINDNTTPYTCPPTGTLAQADEKIVNLIVHNSNPTLTATAPNLKAVELNTATILKAALGHQTVTSTASVTPAWTSSGTPTTSGYGTASFKKGPPPPNDAWNYLDQTPAFTLSNSDKTATVVGFVTSGVRSTTTHVNGTAGKYYAEIKCDLRPSEIVLGVLKTTDSLTITGNGCVTQSSDGRLTIDGTVPGVYIGAWGTGDVISIAWDAGARLAWFRRNSDAWNASGSANPATGTGGVSLTADTGTYALHLHAGANTTAVTVRAKAADYTLTAPSGFTSWIGEALPNIAAAVGTAAGIGAASCVAAVTTRVIVSWFELSGVAATASAAGTAAGIGSSSGVGAVGSVSATTRVIVSWFELSGVAAATSTPGVGTATGIGAATASGAKTAGAQGTAAGLGTATATGRGIQATASTATGIGTATAQGAKVATASGAATGVGAATALTSGAAFVSGAGSASGIGTATASGSTGSAAVSATGTAAGIGAASAQGAKTATASGSAIGLGIASGSSSAAAYVSAVGTASGAGAAAATGFAHSAAAVGTAAGLGAAAATGQKIATATGAAAGSGVASATSGVIGATTGTASGIGTAAATGFTGAVVILSAIGTANGIGSTSGIGFGIQPSATPGDRVTELPFAPRGGSVPASMRGAAVAASRRTAAVAGHDRIAIVPRRDRAA